MYKMKIIISNKLDSLHRSMANLTVPHLDFNSLMRTQTLKQWQLRWNSETQQAECN